SPVDVAGAQGVRGAGEIGQGDPPAETLGDGGPLASPVEAGAHVLEVTHDGVGPEIGQVLRSGRAITAGCYVVGLDGGAAAGAALVDQHDAVVAQRLDEPAGVGGGQRPRVGT